MHPCDPAVRYTSSRLGSQARPARARNRNRIGSAQHTALHTTKGSPLPLRLSDLDLAFWSLAPVQ